MSPRHLSAKRVHCIAMSFAIFLISQYQLASGQHSNQYSHPASAKLVLKNRTKDSGPITKPIANWIFVPEYKLGGRAANQIGPRPAYPKGIHPHAEIESAPVLIQGKQPTQRIRNLLPKSLIPKEAFSVEMWICHHINQPVTAAVICKGIKPGSRVPWTFSFGNWETRFQMQGQKGAHVFLQSRLKEHGGFQQRWVHQVICYDGHDIKVYVNGRQIASGHMQHDQLEMKEPMELELAAYMANEPFMQWGNLVHTVRLYDKSISAAEVVSQFESMKQMVKKGHLFPNLFHFTAGPYLNLVKQNGLKLCWETDRPANAKIEWGPTRKLGQSFSIKHPSRKQDFQITGLFPNRQYFYRVTSQAKGQKPIDTGILTFKTAVKPNEPFKFAVLGDTESRPHINDRLAKMIWGERPNFVVNLGDLTDGGKGDHRFEWTHEYFLGINQLASRIPFMTVPGNGEDDLVWYNHYHNNPKPENYYSFRYGNAAFFMLDSNRRREEFAPGGKQYKWLEQQLSNCDAKWKFVCHHHATYTGEEDDYGNAWEGPSTFGDQEVQKIVPLYEKYGVDIAMFGHLHLYERSLPIRDGKVDHHHGTIHLLAGGGGGHLEDFAPTPAFFSANTHRGHHYVTFQILGNRLEMRTRDSGGRLRDFLILEKTKKGIKTNRPESRK